MCVCGKCFFCFYFSLQTIYLKSFVTSTKLQFKVSDMYQKYDYDVPTLELIATLHKKQFYKFSAKRNFYWFHWFHFKYDFVTFPSSNLIKSWFAFCLMEFFFIHFSSQILNLIDIEALDVLQISIFPLLLPSSSHQLCSINEFKEEEKTCDIKRN